MHNKIYFVRNDKELALINHKKRKDYQQLKKNYKLFQHALCQLFEETLNIKVKTISVKQQKKWLLTRITKQSNIAFVNLDKATFNIKKDNHFKCNVSRVFSYMDEQKLPITFQHDIEKVSVILKKKGFHSIVLVDDDIASGNTIRFVKAEFEKHGIVVKDTISLLDKVISKRDKRLLLDIVDTRDFIEHSFAGGLVCLQNNMLIRTAYHLDGVNLTSRASIPGEKILFFKDRIKLLTKHSPYVNITVL